MAIKKYKHPEYLVETDWLEAHLEDPDLRVFDCSVEVLPNPDLERRKHVPFIYQSGRDNYLTRHIPHAGFIDIPGELSDNSSHLPLMLPSEEQFVQVMSRYGIDDQTRVVLYGTTEPNWAARVWWMLYAFGFKNVSILNGGWNKWLKEGRPFSIKGCTYEKRKFISHPISEAFVDKDVVLAAVEDNGIRIINALPSAIHTGASEITFGRKGRIVNSVNVPFVTLHDPDTGCYLTAEELQNNFDYINTSSAVRIINYCGGGIASSNNAFALSLLGYNNVTVYDGSLLEWGNDDSLPMEVGG